LILVSAAAGEDATASATANPTAQAAPRSARLLWRRREGAQACRARSVLKSVTQPKGKMRFAAQILADTKTSRHGDDLRMSDNFVD
jgi:hypothetical protein